MAQQHSSKPKPARRPSSKPAAGTRTKPQAAAADAAADTQAEPAVHTRPWWRRTGNRVAGFVIRTSLPEIFVVASLCLARYIQNSDFSYPSEVVLDIVLFAVINTVAFYLLRLVLRKLLATHIASLLLAYAMYGYTYTFDPLHDLGNKLIPGSATGFTHAILQVLLMAIVFGLAAWLFTTAVYRIKQVKAATLVQFLVFVVSFVFVVQLGKVGMRMWTIRHDLAYKLPPMSLQQTAAAKAAVTAKPDVYYLLFDRYASSATLQKDYNYDNSAFENFLAGQGFVNRDNAFANYPFTMQSVSSTLAASYHTQLYAQFQNDAKNFQTAFPYRQILDNPPVAQAFKANGYQFNQVSSWWDFTRMSPSADTKPTESFQLRVAGKNYYLTDLQRDIVNKSILSPLLLKGLTFGHTVAFKYTHDRNPTQNFYAEMSAVKSIATDSASAKKPQFTFAHVLSPHDPYVFDAQGNPPTYDGNRTDNGVDETVKYTNQLTYVNTQFEDLISTIRAKDPSAVIIVQADEGPYPKQFRGTLTPGHFYDPINLPLQQMQQKFGILASYYLPGVDTATNAANMDSSVNTFRYVLSHYLGYNLPELPDCNFAVGDKYSLYNYHLVTGQLKGTANPTVCNQYK